MFIEDLMMNSKGHLKREKAEPSLFSDEPAV